MTSSAVVACLILGGGNGVHLTAQETVSFPTEDGGIVFAYLYGTGDRGLVLAHGGRFTKESWAEQAPVFAEIGFQVLAIDFRGRGRSRGGSAGFGYDGVRYDVMAAVRYLHGQGVSAVSVVGASFGGGAAAEAAAEVEPGEIDRLVLLAPSPIDHPDRMTGNKLFITARGDTTGSGTLRLPGITEQYERAPKPKQLVVLDGAAHAQFIFESEQGDRLMQEILQFLSRP